MMRNSIAITCILLFVSGLQAQRIAPDTYWFYFTDKAGNGYSVDQPDAFLSQRSIDRRAWQSLPVDASDLPVTSRYVDSLASLGLDVLHVSKWLNGVLVESSNQQLIDTLYRLSFIDTVQWDHTKEPRYYPPAPSGKRFEDPLAVPPDYQYGFSTEQVTQLKLDYLHEQGYTGNGVTIAVLDAGFYRMQSLPAFEVAYANNKVIAGKSFVQQIDGVYAAHSHGMSVSSIIIANWPDNLVGAAPDATLALALTENPYSETRVEEYAWIEGAEWADSLGSDILNTSLGYTEFDDSTTNFTYEDMDGKTAHISVANGMTASKGMVSVTSAGNSGNDPWHYIGAPADATDILSVGAVDQAGMLAAFSSRGPTFDHRIKPEVSAMGALTAVQATDSTARLGYGTSYASPMIAGAAAVLWQAYPALTSTELMRRIIESGDRYEAPDTEYGYGIPSFRAAFWAITSTGNPSATGQLKAYPNPFTSHLFIEAPGDLGGTYHMQLFDIQGRIIHDTEITAPGRTDLPESISPGIYILQLSNGSEYFRTRIIRR